MSTQQLWKHSFGAWMITFQHKLETGPSVFAPLISVWHRQQQQRQGDPQPDPKRDYSRSLSLSLSGPDDDDSASRLPLAARAKLGSDWRWRCFKFGVRACVVCTFLSLPPSLPCACLCVAWCGRAVARSFSSATAHFIASFIRSLLVRIPASHFAGNMKKLLLICSCSRCAVVEIIGTWDAASSRAVHWRHSFWLPKCGI